MLQEKSSRNNNFDLIRLLAAAQVVFVHAVGHTPVLENHPPWLAHLLDWVILFPGVAVFFVISGYLIPGSYERLQDLPRAYFMRRVLRIYPGLIACLGVSLILLGTFGFLTPEVLNSPTFWGWLFGQFTFGQFYNPEFFRGFGVGAVNGALWTISVELQFYVVVPLLHFMRRRTRLGDVLLAATFLTSFATFCYVDAAINSPAGFRDASPIAKLLFVSLVPHWWMFVLGMLIKRHQNNLRGWFEGRFLYHAAAYTAFAMSRHYLIGRDGPWSAVFYAGYLPERILLATMTVAAAFTRRDLSECLLRGTDISYGVYIYHFLVINVLLELGWMHSLSAVAVVFLLSMAAGSASWFGVEKRALSLKPRVGATVAVPSGACREITDSLPGH